jgi:ribose transport system substrate-binding protein
MEDEPKQGLSRRDLLRRGAVLGAAAASVPTVLSQSAGAATLLGDYDSKRKLPPFVAGRRGGQKPADLPRRIAWANVSDAEFFLAITHSIQAAAKDRKLDFVTAIAYNDYSKNIEQNNTFLQRGICSLCIQPLDAAAQAAPMKQAIDQGIAVMSLVTPPSTVQAVADQYQVGHAQGLAAAKYIKQKLGGKAQVLYMNLDSIQVLIARHHGVLDGVKSAGKGVEIVADIQPKAITQDAVFQVMNTVLQAHPDVNVVLGGDTLVLGALSALQAAGKADPEMYLSGIDGDTQALAAISKGGGPYKASFAFAYNLMGYAWGQFAADWLDGKSIPKVMSFTPIELNSAGAIKKFQADMANVRKTWNRKNRYMTFFGNIDYSTRKQYITYAA